MRSPRDHLPIAAMNAELPEREEFTIPGYPVIVAIAALLPLLLTLSSKYFTADDYWFAGHANMLDGKPSGACSVLQSFSGDWLTGARGNGGWLRPMTRVLWWLDDKLFTIRNPWGYHLTNDVLHAANAALCAWIAQACIARTVTRRSLWRSRGFAPLIAGILFAWFPPSAGAVSWVSGRTDLLAGFFVLSTTLIAIGAQRARPVLIMVTTALACLSKESGFLTPVIVSCATLIVNRRISLSRPQLINIASAAFAAILVFCYRFLVLGTFGGYVEQTQHLALSHIFNWFAWQYSSTAYTSLLPAQGIALCVVFIELATVAMMAIRWSPAKARSALLAAHCLFVMFAASAVAVINLNVPEIEEGRLLYLAAIPVSIGAALLFDSQRSLRPRLFFALPFLVLIFSSLFRFSNNDAAWTHASQKYDAILRPLLTAAEDAKDAKKPFTILYERMNLPTYQEDGLHTFEGAKLFPWSQVKWGLYRKTRGRLQADWGLQSIHIPTGARIALIHSDDRLSIQMLDATAATVVPMEPEAGGTYELNFRTLFAGKNYFQYVCLQVETTSTRPLPPLIMRGRALYPMPSTANGKTPTWFYPLGVFPNTARNRYSLPALDNGDGSEPPRVSAVTFPVRSLE
ncbi:MAG: hypothetical protein ABI579_01775 [Candidatus Sumerlaeota bacterium]